MERSKIIVFAFLGLGVAFFLLMTSFLTKTSETALVNGAMGLVPLAFGALGAHVGRRSVGRAIGLGVGYTVVAFLALVLFFSVLWPML